MQIHYYIECCLLRGLSLDETTVALQYLGVQERLTSTSELPSVRLPELAFLIWLVPNAHV